MVELTPSCRGVIEALLAAPVAWQSPSELARAIGPDPEIEEETIDTLAVLDAGGWLAVWERDDEIVVTLSVAAASRLDVKLVEVGANEVPRWARRGDPEPQAPRASGVFRQERAATLELVVDTSSLAESLLDAEESGTSSNALKWPRLRPSNPIDDFLRPTLLLGLGLSPWPGPGDGRKSTCPSCRSRRLEPTAYCLVCDRWGLDHLLLELPSRRSESGRDPRQEARLIETQRLARKNKRKVRRAAHAVAVAKRRPGRRNQLGPSPA